MSLQAAVLGSPISHSLSPALHRAAYAVLDLDWQYSAIECDEARFPTFFDGLTDEWMGLSLTMPLKEIAFVVVEDVDPVARTVGSINTIYRVDAERGGSWAAANTDVVGMVRSLREAGVEAADSATILGAGATARSAVAALVRLGVRRLNVHARRREAGESVADLAGSWGIEATVADLTPSTMVGDVLISTLPADIAAPWADVETGQDTALLDASYHPWPTPLAQAWSRDRPSAAMASGRDMLRWQAVAQVGLMTGRFPGDLGERNGQGADELMTQVSTAMAEITSR